MDQGPHGTGRTRRRLTCEKVHATAEMKQGQSKCDRARERKRKTKGYCIKRKAKEKESDRLRKKGCAQGESNGDSHDTSLTF